MAAGTVGRDPVSPPVGPPARGGPGPSSAAVALGLSGLLRAAEWHAEQMLHLGRGLLALALAVIVLGIWGGAADWSLPLLVAGLAAIALAWAGTAWLLFRGPYRGWLPYLLIALDGLLLVRLAVFVRAEAARGMGAGLGIVSAAELEDALAALFVLFALSGAFRFSPRLALITTALATSGVAVTAVSIGQPVRAVLPTLVVVALAGLFGTRAAAVLRRIELKAQEEAILERYVPEPLIEELVLAEQPGHEAGKLIPVTLLLTDIRGFTTISEQIGPREAVALLNEYFATVLVPLTNEGGVLDKYIGDGVLAFFEPDESGARPDHSARALRAAREILAAIDAYNTGRPERTPLRIGIAVHRGEALVGSVGAPNRLNYTAIGDAVNVAARLEELNKHFHSSLVVSAATVEAAGEAPADLVGPLSVEVRGRHAPLDVYYLPTP